MQLAIFQILVNLGVKRILHLPGGAAEFDPGAAASHALHFEALRLEPGGQSVHVILAHAEAVGVLFRRQPFVVIGGSRILLVGQQLLKSGLLAGRRLEVNGDSRYRKGRGHRTPVKLRPRARWHVASQRNGSAAVDRARSCGPAAPSVWPSTATVRNTAINKERALRSQARAHGSRESSGF